MSSEPMMRVTAEMTTRVHTLQQQRHTELSAAAAHREHGDYTSAAICEHTAQIHAHMASIYRQVAAFLSGVGLPDAAQVYSPSEGLGVGVGIARWAPPKGASYDELTRWRTFVDELNQTALRQRYLTDELLPAARSAADTGQLAPEDIPGPDPLTATLAEATGETGACPIPSGVEPTDPDEQPQFDRLIGHRVVVAMVDGHRAHGVLHTTDPLLVLHPCEDGPDQIPLEQVVKVSPLPARADAGIWRPGPDGDLVPLVPRDQYPERPVNGGPAAVDGDA